MRLTLSNLTNAIGISKERVKEELKQLERSNMSNYISRFDNRNHSASIQTILSKRYPGQKVTLEPIAEGVTDTQCVKVNGIALLILKRVSLPEKLFRGQNWRDLETRLRMANGEIPDQVRSIFVKNPGGILAQNYPYFNNAQREKLAYIIGRDFGVPKTEVIKSRSGTFSVHTLIENEGSARIYDLKNPRNQARINLQSLQNIGILDIIIENQDRNPGNILVTSRDLPWYSQCFCCSRSKELDLVPIDHALSMQHKNFSLATEVDRIKPPCWKKWKKAAEPLTIKTKQMIQKLNAKQVLRDIARQGIVIDDKIRESIKGNIAFLQRQIEREPNISLSTLYERFLKGQ